MWQYMQHQTRLLHVIPYQSQESIINNHFTNSGSNFFPFVLVLQFAYQKAFYSEEFLFSKKLPTKINITKTKSMTFKVHIKFNQKNCYELHIPLISHFIVKNHILYINNKIYEKKNPENLSSNNFKIVFKLQKKK